MVIARFLHGGPERMTTENRACQQGAFNHRSYLFSLDILIFFPDKIVLRDDPILAVAKNCIDTTPKRDRKFSDGRIVGAYVHAWLATREKSRSMGSTIAADDLNHDDADTAKLFIDGLRTLFRVWIPQFNYILE